MPVTIKFPPPTHPWSVNDIPATVKARIRRSKDKAAWVSSAYYYAIQAAGGRDKPHRQLGPSVVQVSIPFPQRRTRDPHNYTGTVVKHTIDGLVKAGLWPDDNPEWVTVVDPVFDIGGSEVVVTITPRGE